MGYDVNWCAHLPFKKGLKIAAVEKAFKSDKCHAIWESMILIENTYIDFSEFYGKWNEEEFTDLFQFLAKHVEKGSYIDFTGEDDSHWRILFDGEGSYEEQPATVIYDYHPFRTFMEKFEDEMPKTLKKELKKWYRGIEVLNKI